MALYFCVAQTFTVAQFAWILSSKEKFNLSLRVHDTLLNFLQYHFTLFNEHLPSQYASSLKLHFMLCMHRYIHVDTMSCCCSLRQCHCYVCLGKLCLLKHVWLLRLKVYPQLKTSCFVEFTTTYREVWFICKYHYYNMMNINRIGYEQLDFHTKTLFCR